MRKHNAYSLLEMMMVVVIGVVIAVGAYKIFGPSEIQAAVRQEQDNAGRLVDGIFGAYSTAGSFSTLSTPTAAGVLNLPLQSNNTLNTALKRDLVVQPATTTTANDSFDLIYRGLSSKECAALVPALSPRSQGVFIGNNANLQNARGEITNEGAIASQCASSSTVGVTFRFKGDKHDFAATDMDSCMCAPQSESQTLGCPSGTSGSMIQRRTGVCTGGTPSCPSLQWSSWTTTSNTCAADAQPIPPATPVAPGDMCIPVTETQSLPCASGQTGVVLQQRTRACPSNTWGAWTTISSSCQVDPARPTCTPSTQNQTALCPAGQGGQILQERTSFCAADGSFTWGEWKTMSNNCTASCAASGTCCQVSRQNSSEVVYCGAGNYGSIYRDLVRSSTCPTPTSAPVWSGGWNTVAQSGSCTTCPSPAQEQQTQSVPASEACPAGQVGAHTWISNQVSTRTRSYSCPDRTVNLPAPNFTAWSGWSEVSRSSESNTCAPAPDVCATPGSYTITSAVMTLRAGNNNRTVNPYTFGQLQSTPGSSSSDNLEMEGTVTGTFNGSTFTGRVRASQSTTIRGTGTCYAMQANGNPNANLSSCGGGGMPPGLDLSLFMAGNSQGQMSVTTRPCGGGGGSANITTGNLFVYSGVGFISNGNAPAGQTTMVASATYQANPSAGGLRASYANYAITFNGVTKTVLSGSCQVANLSVPQNCTQEQTLDFNGRSLVIKLVASATVGATISANAQVYVTPQ